MNFNLKNFASFVKNIIRNSIEENFEREGRFGNGAFGGGNTHWQKSLRAIKQQGKTLQDTGQLAASIYVDVRSRGALSIDFDGEKFIITDGGWDIGMGSNKPYAQIMNDGGEINRQEREGSAKWKATKNKNGNYQYRFAKANSQTRNTIGRKFIVGPHKILIIPRPYLVLQDEDIIKIENKFNEWFATQI
jgi:phage gpG-like protein